jgi:hypothetical protein
MLPQGGRRGRAAALSVLCVVCVGLLGLALSSQVGARAFAVWRVEECLWGRLRLTPPVWQGRTRAELLGYTYSNMPGAFGPAYGVSPPSVKFHVTQQLPTGPHPMTTDALVTSNNAISFAQAVENTEREDKERIEDVSFSGCVLAYRRQCMFTASRAMPNIACVLPSRPMMPSTL